MSLLCLKRDAGGTWLRQDVWRARCALGSGGVRSDKREGDGATPAGRWRLRRVLFRADRVPPPRTALPLSAIGFQDGWCDDPGDSAYNRPVRLPYGASHERLWRADRLYDLLVVLDHNEAGVPGAGSAVFLHVARPDYGPTSGCVALAELDLRRVLAHAGPATLLCIG